MKSKELGYQEGLPEGLDAASAQDECPVEVEKDVADEVLLLAVVGPGAIESLQPLQCPWLLHLLFQLNQNLVADMAVQQRPQTAVKLSPSALCHLLHGATEQLQRGWKGQLLVDAAHGCRQLLPFLLAKGRLLRHCSGRRNGENMERKNSDQQKR